MAEEALVANVGLERKTVTRELNALVQSGEVEVLRPVALRGENSGILGSRSRRAHYRLCRETDRNYAWQQEVVVRVPATRLFSTIDEEQTHKYERRSIMKQIMTAMMAVTLYVGTTQAADKIVMDGSTTVGPIAKAFAEYYMSLNPDVNVTVSESGSGNGAKSLVNNVCDIANLSRFMKEKEFSAAVDNGVMPVAHVVAMDGLPILVHPSNPVSDLTVEQVRKIYMGEITNWKQVGGADKEIVVISRDTNSGTYETFHGLVMTHKVGDEKIKEKIKDGAEYVGSNGAVRQRVQSTANAIGFAGLGFVDKSVKALKIDDIYPTARTVAAGTYPISRPLFMFTNGYPKLGSHVYRFVTLHLSEKGQEIVEDIGFVPVTQY